MTRNIKNSQDNLFRVGNKLYSANETGIFEAQIRKSWDKNRISDYPSLTQSEAEKLFRDIIDEGYGRFNIEKYGGFKNEVTGKTVSKGNATSYLGREPLGSRPTRAQELKSRPDLIAQRTYQSPQATANLQTNASLDGSKILGPNDQVPQEIAEQFSAIQNRIATEGITDAAGNVIQAPTPGGESNSGSFGDQLQEPYKSMFDIMKGQLDELQKRGETVNPNIEINERSVAEFMRQAEGSLDKFLPYAQKELKDFYSTQLKTAREGFLSGLGYSRDELLRTEQDLERKFKRDFQGIGESAAEQGLAQSGARVKAENELIGETQRDVDSRRRLFGQQAGEVARTFAQKFGTSNLPSANIGASPQVTDRGFSSTGERPIYQLSDDVYKGLVGTEQFAERAATRTRAAELEEAFRTQQAVNQSRNLL